MSKADRLKLYYVGDSDETFDVLKIEEDNSFYRFFDPKLENVLYVNEVTAQHLLETAPDLWSETPEKATVNDDANAISEVKPKKPRKSKG